MLERACFDFILLEDKLAIPDTYGGTSEIYLAQAQGTAPKGDPAPLSALLAGATSRLGIVATLSTLSYHPYTLARLASTIDSLNYTVGGFYSHVTHHDVIPIHVGSEIDPNAGAAAAFGLPADIDYTYATKDISKAVYAQIDYKLTDRLTATGGFRYTWENVSLQQSEGSIFALTGASPLGVVQSKHLSAPAWTFNLAYQLNPQNMFYFAQRGSFRSGNFNGTVVPVNNANFFKNEYAHDFELGYKFNGRVGEVPLHFNAAIYEELVKNAQHAVYAVVGGAPAGFTLNVPRARTRGAEVDTSIGLARWLSLTATGAYSPISFFGGTPQMRAHWDTWSQAMEAAGHIPERRRFRVARDVFIADTDAEAKRLFLKSGLAATWRSYLKEIYVKFGLFGGIIADSGKDVTPESIDEDFLAEHVVLCGSSETVIEKLEALADKVGGWGQLVVNQHDSLDDPKPWEESLRRFASEVCPKVRMPDLEHA